MSSILKQFQADITGLLNTCDYFNDVTIVTEDKADISTIIQKALSPIAVKGGKAGIVVIVEEPEASAPTQAKAPYFTLIKCKLTILENILVNRTAPYGTQKKGYEVGEAIHEVLFEVCPSGELTNPVWPGQPAIRSIGAIPEMPNIMGVECNIEWHAALPQVGKVADPTIANATGSITIATSTGGAALFYSLDGSFPSLAYTAPFATPDAGTLIRAVGTLTGYATSNISQVQL